MSERRDERYYRAWMSHRHVSRRGLLRGLLGGGRAVQRQALQAPLQRARAAALCLGGGGLSGELRWVCGLCHCLPLRPDRPA